jgi:hypothetical protein
LTVRLPAVVFVTKIYFKVGIETVNSVLSRARLWFGPSEIGFHGGKVTVRRPRVRSYEGHELALPTWTAAQAWPLGHEPHADQRLDAQAEACCATAGG